MEYEDIAIHGENLSKVYKLYSKPIDRLIESLHPYKKRYHQDFFALHNVSFDIKKGETVGIIGRNGSGKSTLLKIIAGVLRPTSGDLKVQGKISAILELGAGFNPEMTGIENIYLNMSLNGIDKALTKNKLDEILAFADLGEFIYQPVKSYSSGMQARLGFAVAINIDPDILIIDEALAVGDVAFQRKCFARIEQMKDGGATILFVSHSETSIVNLCDKVIWLNQGEKIVEGNPKIITGLYMKNSNKKFVNKQSIKIELEKLSQYRAPDANLIKSKKERCPEQKIEIEAYFDTALVPKSTIYYEQKGGMIKDVKVTTLSGEMVNVLVYGKDYYYEYVVELFEEIEDVRFSFLIKDMQGIAISGGRYSLKEHENIEILERGKYRVRWKFKCIFNDRLYSFNAGVGYREGFIHRILDAYIFQVKSIEKKIFTANVNCIKLVEVDCNDMGIGRIVRN